MYSNSVHCVSSSHLNPHPCSLTCMTLKTHKDQHSDAMDSWKHV